MRLDPYLGDVTGISNLMVDESRTIAGLLLKDLSDDQWAEAIEEQNVIQKKLYSNSTSSSEMYYLSFTRPSIELSNDN